MYTWTDGAYLMHHGIKGQRWGVRRFQNEDGSLTSAGRERYGDGQSLRDRVRSIDKDKLKKIGIAVGVTAAAAAGGYLLYRNRDAVAKYLKEAGSKTVKSLGSSIERTTQATIDGAMMSIGGLTIARLSEKLPTDDSVDRATRERNQVILDSATAGIKAATKANSSSGKSNSSGGNVGKEVTDKLGAPSKQPVNKNTSEWQNLFKDSQGKQRDDQTRATIKSLAAAGYDISQIQNYLDMVDRGTIQHSWTDGTYLLMGLTPYGRWTC